MTYDYGIDGVSIEMSKYAMSLQNFVFKDTEPQIHFIGGDFYPQADTVIKPEWKRIELTGSNGWAKWENTVWYDKLFNEKMPENSKKSNDLSVEIWRQAVALSKKLGKYLGENNIHLLIPVNVCSNPGNVSLTLATILISEFLKIPVINNNHDFYWEGGNRRIEVLEKGLKEGPRDFFFTNSDIGEIFSLIEMIFPWDSRSWISVNINKSQSKHLIRYNGHNPANVCEIGTAVDTKQYTNISKRKKIDAFKSIRFTTNHS